MSNVLRFLPTAAMFLIASVLVTNLQAQAPAATANTPTPTAAGTYVPGDFFYTVTGGFEQVDLSSQPSGTEPFARLYVQSGVIHPNGKLGTRWPSLGTSMWGAVRLLGSPNQTDTKGIFSVFADPSGQITSDKLSSVGTAIDFFFGPSIRIKSFGADTQRPNSEFDLVLGFGATTPLQSNQVTQAFVAPAFGTIECNTLSSHGKFGPALGSFGIKQSTNGVATGSTSACLLNTNAVTTSGGTATFAPVTTVAFSNADRTSFLLKDFVGGRFNHAFADDQTKRNYYVGTLDFGFGMDSAITGGVFRGSRWVFKADTIFPILIKGNATVYLFGSASLRLQRNITDNSPLILQPAVLTSITGTSSTAVPNVNTVVLPLQQPDRDFYRIGVGIDILSLITKKTQVTPQ